MANYDRYKTATTESFDKKDIMEYLVRIPSDKKLLPIISQIKGKKILDVGLGTGCYTKLLLKDNEVVGVDQNPHLCRLPIKVHQGDAAQLAQLVEAHSFDTVFSTWMTEYLDPSQLSGFFRQAKIVLRENGQLMTTIISHCGFGFAYVTAAKIIRGINKYSYAKKRVISMLNEAGFADIEVINLSAWLGIPWAYLIMARQRAY
jgi:ubiquinone/menaquinone biosynthesis C-methylase UbiE